MSAIPQFDHAAGPAHYWEGRARKFAHEGEGLAAVCSYGMPEFYNRSIQITQRLALEPWLRVAPGTRVLDAGCGVGRWSRWLAAQGAKVTGVDLSPTMTIEARRRAAVEGYRDRCRFIVGDLASFKTHERHELIVGVTVLQHILDDAGLQRALANLASHLEPGGRMVLLEAAPSDCIERCNTPIFMARNLDNYLAAFRRAGLRLDAMTGVDPAPFKTWLLPYYRKLPAAVRWTALAVATALALPIDLVFGRRLARASWHKVFVLSHEAK